jgi:hypothetical protein
MSILKWFKDIFSGLGKVFKKFIEEFAKNLLDKEIETIWKIAYPIVTGLVMSDLSSSEKRKTAYNDICSQLKAGSITFKESQVNLIIESIVFSIKKEF